MPIGGLSRVALARSRRARASAPRCTGRTSRITSAERMLVAATRELKRTSVRVAVEDLEDLLLVRRARWPRPASRVSGGRVVRAPARVADHRREVADDEDDLVPEVLELRAACVSTTVWPRWMSGAVGSTPSLTRSGRPSAHSTAQASPRARPAGSIVRRARQSSCSSRPSRRRSVLAGRARSRSPAPSRRRRRSNAPCTTTGPFATSNRTGIWRRGSGAAPRRVRTPMTESIGPHMPASVR